MSRSAPSSTRLLPPGGIARPTGSRHACRALHTTTASPHPAHSLLPPPLTQVTNPPIDPLREGLVMSLEMRLGGRGNLLQPGAGESACVRRWLAPHEGCGQGLYFCTVACSPPDPNQGSPGCGAASCYALPASCPPSTPTGSYNQIMLKSPVLLESELDAVRNDSALNAQTFSLHYTAGTPHALADALKQLCTQVGWAGGWLWGLGSGPAGAVPVGMFGLQAVGQPASRCRLSCRRCLPCMG